MQQHFVSRCRGRVAKIDCFWWILFIKEMVLLNTILNKLGSRAIREL